MNFQKRFVFDIDGTICTLTDGEYLNAKPLQKRIDEINALYKNGHKIIFFTARGMGSSNNDCEFAKSKWEELTLTQLKTWGVNYHHLFMCKPAGDIYIDDKGIKDEDFFS
jgi:hypothetical protein